MAVLPRDNHSRVNSLTVDHDGGLSDFFRTEIDNAYKNNGVLKMPNTRGQCQRIGLRAIVEARILVWRLMPVLWGRGVNIGFEAFMSDKK